jgi:hypothetical protein
LEVRHGVPYKEQFFRRLVVVQAPREQAESQNNHGYQQDTGLNGYSTQASFLTSEALVFLADCLGDFLGARPRGLVRHTQDDPSKVVNVG